MSDESTDRIGAGNEETRRAPVWFIDVLLIEDYGPEEDYQHFDT